MRIFFLLIFVCYFIAPSTKAQPYDVAEQHDPGIQFRQIPVGSHQLNYAYSGDSNKPGLIFIHGTPGSWGAFEVYLKNQTLQKDFFMVSVDRPGWGLSKIPVKEIDGRFDKQASAIVDLMKYYPDKKWTVVGHSLGASIAPKVALLQPMRVDALLLLAGSLDPKLGKPRWYNRIANTWLLRAMLPRSLNNSNRELMNLKNELAVMAQEISKTKMTARLGVMQGKKDRLVSPKNTLFVDQQWREHFAEVTVIDLPNEGHFLPWKQTDLVIRTIRALTTDNGTKKLLKEFSLEPIN